MANLTYRAERALLGALMRDPDLLEDVRFLAADDFKSDIHREVFDAILSAHGSHPERMGPSFDVAVALAARGPGLAVRYLENLGRSCPEPANAAAYARMVMEASLRRQLLAHAERLFRNAGDLHFEVDRFSQAAGPGHGAERFPSHLMKLAHAMWIHAKGFDPAAEHDAAERASMGPAEVGPTNAPAVGTPGHTVIERSEEGREEEEVLADLIQHHWQNSHVLQWLPAQVFTPGPRRQTYEAIVALAHQEEPVDELTVEWQMARQRAAGHAFGPRPETIGEAASRRKDPGYVAVLAALPVPDGTATMTGRVLLDRYTAAQLNATPAQDSKALGPGTPTRALTLVKTEPHPDPDKKQSPDLQDRPAPRTAPPRSFGRASRVPTELLQPPPSTTGQPNQRGPRPGP